MEMSKSEKFFINSGIFNFIYKKTIYSSFLNFINQELKGKVLEIGCGIGKTTSWLAEKYGEIKIIAIDYDKEQIKIARKNKIANVIFKQGDGTKIKFKNSAFDYVIETGVFHHIKDYKKAVKEASRVLKKNGYFYLIDVSQYFFMLWPIKLFFPPEALLTKKDFIKELEDNGFKVEKSKGRLLFFIAAKKV